MHLMQKAVQVLRAKSIEISEAEANALYIAILLHDIGHGAFSHALEHSIVNGIAHEEISLLFMKQLNKEFEGKLSLAIDIFEGRYHRKFMYQLISSQLDTDRLDYLKRDSFYTGVTEGNISSDRLIKMMNVKNDELVIEEKGIYSVEKFIIARRLMYWQVYLHKTGVVAENLLVKVLKRAKELAEQGVELYGSSAFKYFLYTKITKENFDLNTLNTFAKLDDYDVLSSIKEWISHDDYILATLSRMIINRELLGIQLQNDPFSDKEAEKVIKKAKKALDLEGADIEYFVFWGTLKNQAYNPKLPIKILSKKGKLKEIAKASDQLNLKALTKPVVKYYMCFPKNA